MADNAARIENIGMGLWKAHWWDFLFRGILALAFGIILLFLPGLSLVTFIMLFAAFAFVVGIVLLIQSVTIKDGRWWLRIIEGVIGIAAAVAVVLWPGLTLLTFAYIIGFYWLFTGILDIIVAIKVHKAIGSELLLIAGGILSAILGIILLFYPITGIIAVIQVVGIFSIALGIVLVALAIKLKLTPARAPSAA
jgi:uncharacterized membrane protein HdeD (DUF308 family)